MDLDNDYLWMDNDEFDDSVQTQDLDDLHDETDDHAQDINDDDDSNDEPEDYLSRILKSRGIDRERVKIEDEDGQIKEFRFDDLDEETKYGILANTETAVLSEREEQDLNFLRKNRMNLQDFAKYQKEQAVKEYLEQNQTDKTYTVDALSDDELYKFDLKDRMPDLTDEEVEEQLQKAKESETFFTKQIAALRKEYKELEEEDRQKREAEAQAESEEQYNQLAQSLVEAARNTAELNDNVLDDNDRNEVLSFLLDRDANGQSQFSKLFEDPDALFKMAWYMLKGEEAHQALTDYYKGEIAKARRENKPQPQQKVIRRSTVSKKDAEDDIYDLDSVFKQNKK